MRNTYAILFDLVSFPIFTRKSLVVWKRSFLLFKKTFFSSFLPIFVEPLFYLLAFGYGVGQFIDSIFDQSYAEFVAPAVIGFSALIVSFYESAYGGHSKLWDHKSFSSLILAPVSTDDIAVGEVAWGASKGFLAVISISALVGILGLVDTLSLLLCAPIFLLACWGFSGFGVWLSTVSSRQNILLYTQVFIITPMILFCGTYFPLEYLPSSALSIAYFLPMTHVLMAVRSIINEELNSTFIINIGYLLFLAIVFTNLSAAALKRKIIK